MDSIYLFSADKKVLIDVLENISAKSVYFTIMTIVNFVERICFII